MVPVKLVVFSPLPVPGFWLRAFPRWELLALLMLSALH
jgi:hypothetical protein